MGCLRFFIYCMVGVDFLNFDKRGFYYYDIMNGDVILFLCVVKVNGGYDN